MLLSQRSVHAPRLGAFLSTSAALHPHHRIHAVHNARVVSEDALMLKAFARVGKLARPVCTVLLQGRARITAAGTSVWLGPGDALLMDSKSALVMRQEGDSYASLVLEWD